MRTITRESPACQDVFILGAGFSKAISPVMPTLAELTTPVLQRIKDPAIRETVPFIKTDIEMAMSFLAQRQPWFSESDYLRNKARSLELAGAIGAEIEARTLKVRRETNPANWLLKLAYWLHFRQASIITLNYDTLLEAAFAEIEVGEGPPVYYLDLRNLFPIDFSAQQGGFGIQGAPTAELLKLHGSTNWLYSGRQGFFGELIHYHGIASWVIQEPERQLLEQPTSRVPLIVPPVLDKVGFFENEDMRFLWARASDALRRARRVFCLGYSFPDTDLTMRFLLESSKPPEEADFYLVNVDAKCEERFRRLLPNCYRIDTSFLGSEAIPRLCNSLFTPQFDPEPLGTGRVEAGLVESAIRTRLTSGTRLEAVDRTESVVVDRMTEWGLTLLVGGASIPIRFPWASLEGIIPFVAEARQGVQLVGVDFRLDPERPSLDGYLKQFVKCACSRDVAAVLERAAVIELYYSHVYPEVRLHSRIAPPG